MKRLLFFLIASLVFLSTLLSAQQPNPAISTRHSFAPSNPDAVLLFDDEFDGTALDTTKWNACYPESFSSWGCSNNSSIDLE